MHYLRYTKNYLLSFLNSNLTGCPVLLFGKSDSSKLLLTSVLTRFNLFLNILLCQSIWGTFEK